MATSHHLFAHFLGVLVLQVLLLGRPSTAQECSAEGPCTVDDPCCLEQGDLNRYFVETNADGRPASSPLVILLHGSGLSMRDVLDYNGTKRWTDLAVEEGFLLLTPNGIYEPKLGPIDTDSDNTPRRWNTLLADDLDDEIIDDVGFIAELIDWARDNRGIDTDQVYVAGLSDGALLVHRLLLESPELFTAGASFIGNLPDEKYGEISSPDRPTPLFLLNGFEDIVMPFEGGLVGGIVLASLAGRYDSVRSAEETRDFFIDAMGASSDPSKTGTLDDLVDDDDCTIKWEFYPAEAGEPVIFYTMEGGGHSPPHMNATSQDPITDKFIGNVCQDADGADLAWDFFMSKSAPAP